MGKRLVYRLSFEQQAQLWALWREGARCGRSARCWGAVGDGASDGRRDGWNGAAGPAASRTGADAGGAGGDFAGLAREASLRRSPQAWIGRCAR